MSTDAFRQDVRRPQNVSKFSASCKTNIQIKSSSLGKCVVLNDVDRRSGANLNIRKFHSKFFGAHIHLYICK